MIRAWEESRGQVRSYFGRDNTFSGRVSGTVRKALLPGADAVRTVGPAVGEGEERCGTSTPVGGTELRWLKLKSMADSQHN